MRHKASEEVGESEIIIGLVMFAVGVGIGVLFAPKPGEALRAELAEQARNFPDIYGDLTLENIDREDVERELLKR